MSIKIKALDPDNQTEVTQLSALYKSAYGNRFKLARVKEANFWAVKSSFRFSTIIVVSDNKIIATVSVRKDRENSKHVQLYMPAIDPSYLSNKQLIITLLTDWIQRLALRQEWELIYVYKFLQLAEQAEFACELISGEVTALWPSSLPLNPASISDSQSTDSSNKKSTNTKFKESLGPVLVALRFLSKIDNKKLNLFPPLRHSEFCTHIYKNLNIQANFKATENKDIADFALTADKRAFERRLHQNAGFSISFIEPSLFRDFDQLQNKLSKNSRSADYLALNLEDPKCPFFAEKLENIGFRFGGVLPFIRNRHTLLYYRTQKNFDISSIKSESLLISHLNNSVTESHNPRQSGTIRMHKESGHHKQDLS